MGKQNDTVKLIHSDSYGYTHSLNNVTKTVEAELPGIIPKKLKVKE
jgi:hypothetical protein